MTIRKSSIVVIGLSLLGVYVGIGAVFYHAVEKWNWINSFYFTVITISTVGYGDFSPQTNAGKLFTMPFIFIGVGLFVAVANAFLRQRGKKVVARRKARRS